MDGTVWIAAGDDELKSRTMGFAMFDNVHYDQIRLQGLAVDVLLKLPRANHEDVNARRSSGQ